MRATLLLCAGAILLLGGAVQAARRNSKKSRELPEDITISTSKESQRNGKFFNLFNVVTFENGPCRSTSTISGSDRRNGTCLTSTECNDRGGSINGNCAAGFGACCVFIIDADNGGTVSQNCSYIQNPGYPSSRTDTSSISYTVKKCSDDVCMIRLDFETFTIQGPTVTTEATGGVCTDTFIATTGGNGNVMPTVCGDLTGQHMYIDIGTRASATAMLDFAFSGTSNRQWEIKVTQVECNNPNRPYDNGCVQYLVGTTGRVTNYNFSPTDTTTHLADQHYSVCVRQEEGMGCIEWQVCPDVTPAINVFSLTVHPRTGDNTMDLTTSEVGGGTCREDFVLINGGGAECSCSGIASPARQRFCGVRFTSQNLGTEHAPVCSCITPFTLGVYTDNTADGTSDTNDNPDVQSKGFCLEYRQLPCL